MAVLAVSHCLCNALTGPKFPTICLDLCRLVLELILCLAGILSSTAAAHDILYEHFFSVLYLRSSHLFCLVFFLLQFITMIMPKP